MKLGFGYSFWLILHKVAWSRASEMSLNIVCSHRQSADILFILLSRNNSRFFFISIKLSLFLCFLSYCPWIPESKAAASEVCGLRRRKGRETNRNISLQVCGYVILYKNDNVFFGFFFKSNFIQKMNVLFKCFYCFCCLKFWMLTSSLHFFFSVMTYLKL